jgi:membrane-bound lytic murein transglycosylase F
MMPAVPPNLYPLLKLGLRYGWVGAWFAAAASIATCSPRATVLEQVKTLGELRVATVNSPTTYYAGSDGPVGFEYDLARGFAEYLGVQVRMVLAASPPETLNLLDRGDAHIAAAGLGISPAREARYRFSQPLLVVQPQLVYRSGQPRPRNLGELQGRLQVTAGTLHSERLRVLKAEYPQLVWDEKPDSEPEELLYKVANGDLDYTIANSDIIAIHRRYYPQLRVAFSLAESQELAWAFARKLDSSLYDQAGAYLRSISNSELERLRDRYFGHVEQVDYYGAVALATHVESRLPRFRAYFEEAASLHNLDWRLLAAIGYQESLWNPAAVSPTGVRGLMMLTNATAAFLNVADREDPRQSIFGGARYFRRMLDLLPPEIAEPDRTWMALAAYNMGLGHLLDARELTAQLGGNANRWLDVRNSLPLLTQRKWHAQTRYGYARGYEALHYVGNIRTFYDMLVWITDGRGNPQPEPEPPVKAPEVKPPTVKETRDPLNIDTPVL